ncbi:MAG: L-threonylcarbamoyladenylate synthase [Chloroflexota bacterium]
MQTQVLSTDNPTAFKHAHDVLRNGGLVAFPTDTVYGLAALTFCPEGIHGLFIAKRRNSSKAIAVLLHSPSELDQVTSQVNQVAQRLINRFWPGPLTIVLPKHPNIPDVLAPSSKIGVRIPDHPIASQLLRLTGPLAVTSANISNQPNTNTAQEVLDQLKGRIHLVLDGGRSPGGQPSTVVDCTSPELNILRPGPISIEELTAALQ